MNDGTTFVADDPRAAIAADARGNEPPAEDQELLDARDGQRRETTVLPREAP